MSGRDRRGGGFTGDSGECWVGRRGESRLLRLAWACGLDAWGMSQLVWVMCMGGGLVVRRF